LDAEMSVDGKPYEVRGGVLTLDLPEGEHRVQVSAPSHSPITTVINVGENSPKRYRFLLYPKDPPRPPKGERGMAVWYGWVVDGGSLRPIKGVVVEVETPWGTFRARTDDEGYYRLTFPVRPADGEEPHHAKVRFLKEGYTQLVREDLVVEGVRRLNATLVEGSGRRVVRKEHGLLSPKEPPDVKKKARPPRASDERLLATLLIPPTTIRVGTDCDCTTCTSVSVVSLETYVRFGLDDEWIASWPDHSLRAGAVPYRSYGAWYVAHPLTSSYDICNSTCCQVWDPSDSYASTEAAAVYTSGIMLDDSGEVARSEYSAENNDCGCGDGYSGDGVYWPCIYDPVCSGEVCNGHGRGMCQWGSSRWADSGYTWKWINDHYYNPGGYYLSTPMHITAASVSPTAVCEGDTFRIDLSVASFAEYEHTHIMLGASIYNGTFFSDPQRDTLVVIPPGTTATYRHFVVPSGVSPGTYDVLVALWFDVDENSQINSGDFYMYSLWIPEALEVCSAVSTREDREIILRRGNLFVDGRYEIYTPDGRKIGEGEGTVRFPRRGIFFVKRGSRTYRVVVR